MISPESIAIVGASADFTKINGRPLKYLLDKGYKGRIYPVNPKYERLADLRCYPDVSEIPGAVDLAIVAVPANEVIPVVRKLGAKAVRAAIIFSSGFGEIDETGRERQRQLADEAERAGLRLCGPNCLGLINAFEAVVATFSQYAAGHIPSGPVAFVTQSGAFGTAIAALARLRGAGLGYFVNTGNEADVTFAEVMRHLLDDPRIRVGAGYIEGLGGGADLIATAEHALNVGKPLVLTKVGRMAAGSVAAASHTGSLAGEDRIFDAVAKQYAIIRARNEEHMLDLVEVLTACPLPAGNGVGLITQSGGAGVLMADRAEELGLQVPALAEGTQRAMKAVIPGFGTTGNPVDVTGQFLAEPGLLLESVTLVLADPSVSVGIVWLQLMHGHVEPLIEVFTRIKASVSKPFVVAWVAAPEAGVAALKALGIPVLRGAEPAVDAVAGLVTYAERRRRWFADAAERKRMTLPDLKLPPAAGPVKTKEASGLLAQCGVSIADAEFAASAGEAAQAAETLGYPVAMKIESIDILHKTEANGVHLNLNSPQAVHLAFNALMDDARAYKPDARVAGVIVQKMMKGRVEMLVGLQNDPVFGPVVTAGLGGVFVEVLRDVSFRRCPVTAREADEMLSELRGRSILAASRGRPPVDTHALIELICAVSQFGAVAGNRLGELDLNPVLVDRVGATAVDIVLVLRDRDLGKTLW